VAGWRLGRRTIETLTDTAPVGAADKVTAVVSQIPGVVAVERVRVRPAGATLFVDLNVTVSRTLPLDRVKAIKAQIETAVHAEFPKAETAVNIDPHALDDETVLERVMVIARNRGLAVHHVTVQSIGGRLSVSLDLELEGSLTLGEAHEIASALEQAARDELGTDVEVETHIEPLEPSDLAGRDAPPERVAAVRAALVRLAANLGFVRDVHEVRVRETDDGEIVNFHGYADPALTVSEVHQRIDDLERALRQQFPSIKRVVGHAEPPP
jgi:divalent metal cation (Fe/Co/Zn/Cd) transporter